MMAERDWTDAGHGWQGKQARLRLVGWSRQRRVVLLRRKLDRPLVLRSPSRSSRCSALPRSARIGRSGNMLRW